MRFSEIIARVYRDVFTHSDPDTDAPYVHFPRGMDSYQDRLDFLNRAVKRLHEIESAKANDAQDQRPGDQGNQPEGERHD